MKRIGLVLLLGLLCACVLYGCQKGAEAKVLCSVCNKQVERTLATQSDGKWICRDCAAKAAAATAAGEKPADALVDCAGGCGMRMAKADARLIDGKYYCPGCAVFAEAKARSQDPPPGTEAH